MLIVICGTGPNETIMERKLSDANDWDATVRSIAAGEWTDISMVYSTGEGFDALPSMAKQVADIWAERDEPLADWQKDFLRDNGIGKRRLPAENIREIGRNATVAEPLRTIINSFAGGFGR